VQETLTDFVADDSHFRQHMQQTPVALRTRRATRFGGLRVVAGCTLYTDTHEFACYVQVLYSS